MKHVSIGLLIVLASMASSAMNQQSGIATESKPSSFQPKPLDDAWSKWLIGKWEITAVHSDLLADESDASGESNAEVGAGYTIEFRLNGQFVIWEKWAETGGMTDEQKKQVKEALGKYV